MNSDQLKGRWMRFKSELNQQWGKLTDDSNVGRSSDCYKRDSEQL